MLAKRTRTPEYRCWSSIKTRCYNPNSRGYQWYGARGISMCQAWRDSFTAFLAHIGQRPTDLHTLDRIDNDGNYEPGNVRWATRNEQSQNTRLTRLLAHDGETLSLSAWARRLGIDPKSLRERLRHNSTAVALSHQRMDAPRSIGRKCPRRSRSATGFKGVYRNGRMFNARIHVNGVVEYLGSFGDPLDAALAYNRRATEVFGTYARVNEVPQ